MNVPPEVTASIENSRRFPVLAGSKLLEKIEWSATPMGPHYLLSFEELKKNHLKVQSEDCLVIGSYTVDRPFNEDICEIVLCLTNGHVEIIHAKEAHPLRLATSFAQLSSALLAFFQLHQRLSTLPPSESPSGCWQAFEKSLEAIDLDAFQHPYSFLGNMIDERQTMS